MIPTIEMKDNKYSYAVIGQREGRHGLALGHSYDVVDHRVGRGVPAQSAVKQRNNRALFEIHLPAPGPAKVLWTMLALLTTTMLPGPLAEASGELSGTITGDT